MIICYKKKRDAVKAGWLKTMADWSRNAKGTNRAFGEQAKRIF